MRYIYYMNVGSLPEDKCRKYVDEIMKKFKEQDVIPADKTLFVAVREGDGQTRIEALPE